MKNKKGQIMSNKSARRTRRKGLKVLPPGGLATSHDTNKTLLTSMLGKSFKN